MIDSSKHLSGMDVRRTRRRDRRKPLLGKPCTRNRKKFTDFSQDKLLEFCRWHYKQYIGGLTFSARCIRDTPSRRPLRPASPC